MAERLLMKDGLDKQAVSRLSASLASVFPDFQDLQFQVEAFRELDSLELKARVRYLIKVLACFLPQDFVETAEGFKKLPANWVEGDPANVLAGFAAWPIIDYVAAYGLDYPDLALETLRCLTPLFSAEFALRPFVLKHPDTTFKHLADWIEDDDAHVRRLVSEGTRPRLPWGQVLRPFVRDPGAVISLLEPLKDDPSDYVRRSVANSLNDIGKDHPDTVIQCCRSWLVDASPERHWIIRHATRSLVKSGHPGVFELLGYTTDPQIEIGPLLLDAQQIMLGQTLAFTFDVISTADIAQQVVIDYAIHFVKANGQTRPKVFKLKNLELAPGSRQKIVKTHAFKEITTRTYYEGEHRIELLINGQSSSSQNFFLYP